MLPTGPASAVRITVHQPRGSTASVCTLAGSARRRDAGDAIVIVGHDLGRLAALADSATLLARGRAVGQGSANATLTADALTQAYGVAVSIATAGGRRIFWSEG
jgi:ABC-type cobalamin transport system ATPase subunit